MSGKRNTRWLRRGSVALALVAATALPLAVALAADGTVVDNNSLPALAAPFIAIFVAGAGLIIWVNKQFVTRDELLLRLAKLGTIDELEEKVHVLNMEIAVMRERTSGRWKVES